MKIVFNMSEEQYHSTHAFSASMAKNMLISPLQAWHYSWHNIELVEKKTPAMELGKAYHKAVLEGLDVYQELYCSEPLPEDYPNALRTVQDAKDFLSDIGEKVTGAKSALMERAKDNGARIWDDVYQELTGDKTVISADHNKRIIEARELIEEDQNILDLLDGCSYEVSFFWEENGVHFKCRMDAMKAGHVIDLKTFSPINKRPIREAAVQAVVNENYGVQSVLYLRAMRKAYEAMQDGTLEVINGNFDPVKVNKFAFIFLRTGEIQDVVSFEYSPIDEIGGNTIQHNEYFKRSVEKLQFAVSKYKYFTEQFGSKRWKEEQQIRTLCDQDFPVYAL